MTTTTLTPAAGTLSYLSCRLSPVTDDRIRRVVTPRRTAEKLMVARHCGPGLPCYRPSRLCAVSCLPALILTLAVWRHGYRLCA